MKLIAVINPLSIYYSGSTRKKFWEENLTPVTTRSCGRHNVRKLKEIKNVEQYTNSEISLKLDFMDNMEVTFSGSRNYVGRTVKGLNNSLTLRIRRRSNKKQKSNTDNTGVVTKNNMKLHEEVKDLPYLLYRKRQVKNEPTE